MTSNEEKKLHLTNDNLYWELVDDDGEHDGMLHVVSTVDGSEIKIDIKDIVKPFLHSQKERAWQEGFEQGIKTERKSADKYWSKKLHLLKTNPGDSSYLFHPDNKSLDIKPTDLDMEWKEKPTIEKERVVIADDGDYVKVPMTVIKHIWDMRMPQTPHWRESGEIHYNKAIEDVFRLIKPSKSQRLSDLKTKIEEKL